MSFPISKRPFQSLRPKSPQPCRLVEYWWLCPKSQQVLLKCRWLKGSGGIRHSSHRTLRAVWTAFPQLLPQLAPSVWPMQPWLLAIADQSHQRTPAFHFLFSLPSRRKQDPLCSPTGLVAADSHSLELPWLQLCYPGVHRMFVGTESEGCQAYDYFSFASWRLAVYNSDHLPLISSLPRECRLQGQQ